MPMPLFTGYSHLRRWHLFKQLETVHVDQRLKIRLIVNDENPVWLLHLVPPASQGLMMEPLHVALTMFAGYTEIIKSG